jgi:transposase InsO family protein
MEIQAPENFSFEAAKWLAWKQRFQRFRAASDLGSKPQERQVAMLLYSIGARSEDIFTSFQLTDEEAKTYDTVVTKFDNHFIVKRNVIFERVQFNRRIQNDGEDAETFITALHKLSETCEFGTLRDELIRDRVVVGIRDAKLSERLQLDDKLTLEKTVTLVRQAEQVRQQQAVLRGPALSDSNIDAIKAPQQHKAKSYEPMSQGHNQHQKACGWCGMTQRHEQHQCPARNARCRNCGKRGHYDKVCRSRSIHTVDEVDNTDALFLNTIGDQAPSDVWQAEINVNHEPVKFKLDTGADATVLPKHLFDQRFNEHLLPADKCLCGPNRAKLDVAGYFMATLEWKQKRASHKVYVIRDVHQPLLGRDAIDSLGLIKRIAVVASNNDPRQAYPELFTGLGCMKGEYTIRLKDDARPHAVYAPRRLAINLLTPLKEQLDILLKLGVIKRIDEPTPWIAPIVVVPKQKGIRLCVDLTQLNHAVLREQYTMPAIDQMLGRMAGAAVFSKLDCNSGFHQIPLSAESMLLTTFTTPFGRFAYTRFPFGISSASEVFQKRMNDILEGLEGVLCLIDDILVFGKDQAEHDSRLHAVLQRLRYANVTLNDKCAFSQTRIKFAGHVISADGISPDNDRLSAILKMAPPTNVSEMRCFLGMVNQLAKFSADITELAEPLHELIRNNRTWIWDSVQQKAFNDVKQALSSSPVLALYDGNKPTIVSADSSSYGLGAVLKQKQPDGTWRPVMYASRTLSDTERRYAQVEKECLALTWACEKFQDFLVGGECFVLQTDHKPLVALLSPTRALDDVPPRIQRFRIRLRRFYFNVEYVPGHEMGTADTLSRFPLLAQPELVDSSDIVEHYVSYVVDTLPLTDVMISKVRAALALDGDLQSVIKYANDGWPDDATTLTPQLRGYWHSREQYTMCNNLLLCNARIVIPSSLRQTTLEALHVGHLGIEKCRAKARETVWWPKIGDDIQRFVSACSTCQHYAHDRVEPLLPTPLPDLPWQKVGTDLFELNGRNYVVVVDYYSRYIELMELRSKTTNDVINALRTIFSRHGVPLTVFSDNGPCYAATEFATFADTYGFSHETSSPRYAQSNGAAERAVQTAKNLLKKADDPYLALLSYRSTPLANGYSPAQLLMGRQIRSTVPAISASLKPSTPDVSKLQEFEKDAKQQQAHSYNKRHRARDRSLWHVGDHVWIPDLHTEATIAKALPYRSFQLCTTGGNTVRRNGRALRHVLPSKAPSQVAPPTPPSAAPTNTRCRLTDTALPPAPAQPASPAPAGYVTRSGRLVKPVIRP